MENENFESVYAVLAEEEIRRKQDVENYMDRDLFSTIKQDVLTEPRIKIVAGLRGIGKTTMLLHLANNTQNSIFFSLDHPVFETVNLYNFVKYLFTIKGFRNFFIDEAHNYLAWSKEIKSLYDWNKGLCFVISGSSALGLYSLDRRACFYELPPLSFSEFLRYSNILITETVDWRDYKKSMEFSVKRNLEKSLNDYLKMGGFLGQLNMSEENCIKTLYLAIRRSIREDSVMYAKMSKEKVYDLEKIVAFLALSKPGELSYNSLSSTLGIGKGTIMELLDILQKMGVVRVLTPLPVSSSAVRQQPKMIFSHPSLRYIVSKSINSLPEKGAMREEFAVFHLVNLGYGVYTIKGEKKSPDYIIKKNGKKEIIEIGGPSKGRSQLTEEGIILKDYNLIALGFRTQFSPVSD
ncbi:MAG: AAA family ATPase [Candidatus Micrarchaeota archaeon]